jgi:hypothetical protein
VIAYSEFFGVLQSVSFPKIHRPLKMSLRIKKKREIEARSPLIIACGSRAWVKKEIVATIKAKVKMRHIDEVLR